MIDHHTTQRRRTIQGGLLRRFWRYLTTPRSDPADRLTEASARILAQKRVEAIATLGDRWLLAKGSKHRGWK